MKNKKLINNIYENWNNLSTMNIEDEVNIFSFEKVSKSYNLEFEIFSIISL